ncbi:MAG: alkaline phosphatase [Bacteroides sp.]|nr:alkaline phosphatase [Bacteroides sp.]
MIKRYLTCILLAVAATLGASAREARYIFYFIGDGMGMGHVNTAETYNRDVLKSDQPLLMLTFPVAGQARTYSFNSPITDSAAAGTALSTGFKTVNSRVAMTPDSVDLQSVAADLMKAGYAVGVGTTVAGDDATPAAFYAHALGRYESGSIARYAPASGLRFLSGGGFKILSDSVAQQWLKEMEQSDFVTVRTFDRFRALPDADRKRRILMYPEISIHDQASYTIDSIPGAMKLAEMTEACLETLQTANPERFFMMMEGGNIDWGAHANDGATVIKEILNFQEAIGKAYEFYLSHPDETLIVITADHDTGGMALGREDNRKNPHLELIDNQKISKDYLNEQLRPVREGEKKPMTEEELTIFLKDNFGIGETILLTSEEMESIRGAYRHAYITRDGEETETWYQRFDPFVTTLYDILNRQYGIGWTTSSHTANPVPIFAIGAGAELFGGALDNTEIPRRILKAAGVKAQRFE